MNEAKGLMTLAPTLMAPKVCH